LSGEAAARFEPYRRVLLRHAYRMLGGLSEAEDVVQDAYLRWAVALETTAVDEDRAFLRTIVTRLCVDRLRSARARRETYPGPWLPDPIVDDPHSDPEQLALLADDVSFALMLALERLTPLERAAFLLHDVLDVPFAEIAQTLGRSRDAVKQLASRARDRVREPRMHVPARQPGVLQMRDAFARAIASDDLAELQRLLTHDVVFVSDGGGKAVAAIVPLVGPDRVGRFLLGIARKGRGLSIRYATVNGAPGFVAFDQAGTLVQTLALEIHGTTIGAIYATRNPDKLCEVARRLPGHESEARLL